MLLPVAGLVEMKAELLSEILTSQVEIRSLQTALRSLLVIKYQIIFWNSKI